MINPKTLKTIRSKQGYTQEALALRCAEIGQPVDKITISRIERGKGGAQKASTLSALAAALRVSPDMLSAEIHEDEKARLDDDALDNALWLVAKRYRASPALIRALAPLAFTVLAELHLNNRKTKLEECVQALIAMEEKFPTSVAPVGVERVAEALEFERASIADRDLFNDLRPDDDRCLPANWQFESHAPFPTWLAQALHTVEPESHLDWWNPKDGIDFYLCRNEALAFCEGDIDLTNAVISGAVAINRLPAGFLTDPELKLRAMREQREAAGVLAETYLRNLGIDLDSVSI